MEEMAEAGAEEESSQRLLQMELTGKPGVVAMVVVGVVALAPALMIPIIQYKVDWGDLAVEAEVEESTNLVRRLQKVAILLAAVVVVVAGPLIAPVPWVDRT